MVVLKIQSNIMMEVFAKTINGFDNSRKKAPTQMFGRVLNTPRITAMIIEAPTAGM